MPAASGPSCPCSKILLVDATFKDNLNSVASKSNEGKEDNFKGLST
jgi:hypothetical protein